LSALPSEVTWDDEADRALRNDGQSRLWRDNTPIDVFLNTTPFHDQVALRKYAESFAGTSVPFLSCMDVAKFKIFFNQTKDWADVEDMILASSKDVTRVVGTLTQYVGDNDDRISRLHELVRNKN
jgi:hypothetical protein